MSSAPLSIVEGSVDGSPAIYMTASEIGGEYMHVYIGKGPGIIETYYGKFQKGLAPVYEEILSTFRFTGK